MSPLGLKIQGRQALDASQQRHPSSNVSSRMDRTEISCRTTRISRIIAFHRSSSSNCDQLSVVATVNAGGLHSCRSNAGGLRSCRSFCPSNAHTYAPGHMLPFPQGRRLTSPFDAESTSLSPRGCKAYINRESPSDAHVRRSEAKEAV